MVPRHLQFLKTLTHSVNAVGSRVSCNPAPTDTDADWLVLVDDKMIDDLLAELSVEGFITTTDQEYTGEQESPFMSFKRGEDNLIVTTSRDFNHKFLAATGVAKRLNLMEKEDRKMLFQAVLYGKIPDKVGEISFDDENPFS